MNNFFVQNLAEVKQKDQKFIFIALHIMCLAGVILLGFNNYLLFHCVSELFSIVIASVIFIVSINVSYEFNNSSYNFLLLGVAYGFVGAVDLLHTLTYKGMGVFTGYTADLPTQLWIFARYMESISLLLVCILSSRKIKFLTVFCSYSAITIILFLSIFRWRVFPACFIEGIGLTAFKKVSEYIICGILLMSVYFLVQNKKLFEPRVFWFLILSFIFTILSEISFVFYSNVSGLSNITGHIFKLVSFYCIYKAVVEVNLKMPYRELYKTGMDYYRCIKLLPEAILVYTHGRLAFINDAGLRLYGVSNPSDIMGKPVSSFIPSHYASVLENMVSEQIKSGVKPLSLIEHKVIRPDGSFSDVEIVITPHFYRSEPAILFIIRDISERKRVEKLENELQEGERKLKETIEYEKLKTTFFSNLSHELRTPLNVILGTIQLLELPHKSDKASMTGSGIFKHIKTMKQNCYRLLRLTNNLIDITRVDSGFLSINLQNCNIVNVIEEIVLSVAGYTKSKGIDLVFDTDVEEKFIACDPDKIERIILNLLSNAIKFTDRGGNITVSILDKADRIFISVKDTGVGVPKNKLTTIFDRFVQVDQTLARNHEGSGIGLSLVKSLVEMHGGSIFAESIEGKGSEFTISLPVRAADGSGTSVNTHAVICQSKIEKINIEFADIYSLM